MARFVVLGMFLLIGMATPSQAQETWFDDPVFLPLPGEARFAAVGEILGAGRKDVVVSTIDGDVWVFERTGVGIGLSLAEELQTGLFSNVVVGNFVDGGAEELAISFEAPSGDSLVVWQYDGGEFRRIQSLFGIGLNNLGAGDVNGDGFADIVAGGLADSVAIYLGSSGGLARDAAYYAKVQVGCATGNYISSATLGDANGDGFIDILVTVLNNQFCGPLFTGTGYLLGDGAGNFGSLNWVIQEHSGSIYRRVVIEDVDGDLANDFTVSSSVIDFFMGPSSGWSEIEYFDPLISVDAYRFTDINGDDHLDLVGANGGWFFTATGDGDGGFELNGHHHGGAEDLELVDIDDDGRPDVLGCDADGFLTIYRNIYGEDPTSVPVADVGESLRMLSSNPVGGAMRFAIESRDVGMATLTVSDPGGRVQYSEQLAVGLGTEEFTVDEDFGGAGVKFLRVVLPDGSSNRSKFVWLGR